MLIHSRGRQFSVPGALKSCLPLTRRCPSFLATPDTQLLPCRVEVEGCLEHSKGIPAVSSLSPSAHELSLSSSKDLSSIKRSGESSCSRIGVRGLGVDNLEEGQLDFYNTHRRVTFGRNRRSPNPYTWPNSTPHGDRVTGCLRCSPARR